MSHRLAWGKRGLIGAAVGRRPVFRVAGLAGVAVVVLCLVARVGVVHAQVATVQFQSTYRAYNVWTEWTPNKCTKTEPIYGYEPDAPGTYPVVFYVHSVLADWFGNEEGKRVAELAAGQGFVAAAVTYDSWLALNARRVDGNASCIFSPGAASNPVAQVCARPEADCSRGLLVMGFSLGGAIAGRAKNFNPQVQGAWLTGTGTDASPEAVAPPAGTRALPNDRLRITVGQRDVLGLAGLNEVTGQSCSSSPCLSADGSGYYVVQDSEVADGAADHCYWMSVSAPNARNSCTKVPTFDPGFAPPSTTPWSLITDLNWLRTTLG
jgi:dienelactone hydrolase